MNLELLFCIINFLLFFALDIFLFRGKKNQILKLIVTVWAVSAFTGIFYFLNPFSALPYDVSIWPFIFLFSCFFICLLPFTKTNEATLEKKEFVYNIKLFNITATLVALCAFEPFVEILYSIDQRGLVELGNAYAELTSGLTESRSNFSSIGRILYSFEEYMKFITIPLFFTYLTIENKRKIILIGLGCAAFMPSLQNMVHGERYYVMITTFSFVFNFLMFKTRLSTEVKDKLIMYGIATAIILSVLFVSISITRFGKDSTYDQEYGTAYQFIRYFGESYTRFNTEVWHLENFQNGTFSLASFYNYFYGMDIDIEENNFKLGFVSNNFYTFIGDFFIDFGYYTLPILAILSFMFYRFINNRKTFITLGDIFLINIYANILLFGIVYFIYRNGFIHMLWAIILSIVFNSVSSFSKR